MNGLNGWLRGCCKCAEDHAAALAPPFAGMPKPERCSGASMHDFMMAQAKVGGPVGAMFTAMTTASEGEYIWPDGHFSNVPPLQIEADEVRSRRCNRTGAYAPGDRGWHRVDEKPGFDGSFDIRRWLAQTEGLAKVVVASSVDRDSLLKSYITARKTNYESIDRFFGEPGLPLARQTFNSPANQGAIRLLAERLADPVFAASLSPVEQAEATLLVSSPDDFVSCVARSKAARKA